MGCGASNETRTANSSDAVAAVPSSPNPNPPKAAVKSSDAAPTSSSTGASNPNDDGAGVEAPPAAAPVSQNAIRSATDPQWRGRNEAQKPSPSSFLYGANPQFRNGR